MSKFTMKDLFITFFKINSVTFGGGYTIVTVVKDVFVDELKLLSEEEMLDILALAQGGPGAMAISTSILTGYRLKGPIGGIVALVASSLPCLIILSLVSIFYNEFKENFFVRSAFDGISGMVTAALLLTVYNMGKNSYRKYPGFTLIMVALIFVLGYFLKVKTAYLIVFCAAVGILVFGLADRRSGNDD
ncbi:chromate transporter [Peptoniphilus catoniae]|uniref:chromate transporter n=1 Tax=Peptoniphilus catoniae TaxID=1660341 RepID=UPI0010FD392F|nr:chromate transporter [Peptoniphilus catoniae]